MLDEELLDQIEKKDESPNEIVELDDGGNTTLYDMEEVKNNDEGDKPKKSKKQKKPKGPSKWSTLSKKKKIIIIVSGSIVLLVIIILVVYFCFLRKDKKMDEKPDEPIVIVEKENYRYEDGKLIFVDKDKNDLGSYECKNKDEDLCYIAYNSNEDEFDTAKYVYENGLPVEDRTDILDDRYALVYDNDKKENGKVLLYDFKDEKEVGTYLLAKVIDEDKVILKDEKDKYGIIEIDGDKTNNLVDFKYDYLGFIKDTENIVAMNNLSYYLLDMKGKEVTKGIPGEIKNFGSKYISVKIDDKYYVFDYNGKKATDMDYGYIAFSGDYVLGIDNKKVFVYDSSMNPLNMVGVKLKSSNYNTKVVFDKDKKQIKKEEAFSVTVNKDNVRIDYDEEYKVINIYEGKLSSKMEYISYFDGVLYIYSDASKDNFLGSYTCTNPNIVDSSTTELTNCFIAREHVLLNRGNDASATGLLPIYNKRYVFIQDNKNVKTDDNIILWDLNQNKKQANYTEVDAGYYKNNTGISFVDTANTLVMARNTSGSLGIIRIENSDLTGIISFKDNNESISFLKENLLVKRKDGTYHLFDIKGNELTNKDTEIKQEIVDYNDQVVQVKNDKLYMVYELTGKIVKTDKELEYVKLFDKFFVGISTDGKINVYSYAGAVLTEEKDIVVKDNYDKAYKIDSFGGNYRLSILNADGTEMPGELFSITTGEE